MTPYCVRWSLSREDVLRQACTRTQQQLVTSIPTHGIAWAVAAGSHVGGLCTQYPGVPAGGLGVLSTQYPLQHHHPSSGYLSTALGMVCGKDHQGVG